MAASRTPISTDPLLGGNDDPDIVIFPPETTIKKSEKYFLKNGKNAD
jgi:hypothetical protein